ncbi:hypothetical protein M0805_009011 [Coniferiporia weirii]|nr:hypothetical protein M0805_009011 [Coniferiporia weirii]
MAYVNTRPGPSTAAPQDASRTMVLHDSQPYEEGRSDPTHGDSELIGGSSVAHVQGVLRLRGAPRSTPRVAWTDDVVDNEGLDKKKSKICCIYHKPRRFDESSSESSDSSGSDVDSDSSSGGRARPHGRLAQANRRHRAHPHPHGEGDGEHSDAGGECAHAPRDGNQSGSVQELEGSDPEPNAYEKQPSAGKGRKGKARSGLAQGH